MSISYFAATRHSKVLSQPDATLLPYSKADGRGCDAEMSKQPPDASIHCRGRQPVMTPRLRSGTSLQRALEALRELSAHATRVAAGSSGIAVDDHRNDYLWWVKKAEVHLASVFEEEPVWESLHSNYFWRIRDLGPQSPRPAELINDELRRQASRLDRLASAIEQAIKWVQADARRIAVLDTHVVLHFEPPEQIRWREVVGTDEVRLVLPLRVVEELDEKKYTARSELADRARRILSSLRLQIASAERDRFEVRPGTTLEVHVPEEPRRRSADGDQEILETCLELISAGADLQLVSDDAAVDIRARSFDIPVCRMPEQYLRRHPGKKE